LSDESRQLSLSITLATAEGLGDVELLAGELLAASQDAKLPRRLAALAHRAGHPYRPPTAHPQDG
jgi:hypothetical protein